MQELNNFYRSWYNQLDGSCFGVQASCPMYRSRNESRTVAEKPSRSMHARSPWIDPQPSHPYVSSLDDRDHTRDPNEMKDEPSLDKDFLHNRGGVIDLREAQRLAARFFSQYPDASLGPPAICRGVATRSDRRPNPEVSVDRCWSRGQNRDTDLGWAERGQPNADNLYPPPSRPQLVLEDWDDEGVPEDSRRECSDLYGYGTSRNRKRDEEMWDGVGLRYSFARKEPEYRPNPEPLELEGGVRVTKRVDWSDLIRSDGKKLDDGFNSLLTKRAMCQNYRCALENSHRKEHEDNLNPEGSPYSRRSENYVGSERYPNRGEPEVPRERRYFDKLFPKRAEFLQDRNVESRGGQVASAGRDNWRTEGETYSGARGRLGYPERVRDKRRYDEEDSRHPLHLSTGYRGSSRARVDRDKSSVDQNPPFRKWPLVKSDYFQRASITNRDILAVYYGKRGSSSRSCKHKPKERTWNSALSAPHPGFSRHHSVSKPSKPETHQTGQFYQIPFRGMATPGPGRGRGRGRSRGRGSVVGPIPGSGRGLPDLDMDVERRGNKRWEKAMVEGSEVKRFKRETQSDKLYLMHNRKAIAEKHNEHDAIEVLPNVSSAHRPVKVPEAAMKEKGRDEAGSAAQNSKDEHKTFTVEQRKGQEPTNGSWDDEEDSWSDGGEEERHMEVTCGASPKNDGVRNGDLVTGKEADVVSFQASEFRAVTQLEGECPEDDDGADWESLASELDDQLADIFVHKRSDNAAADGDTISRNSDDGGVARTDFGAQLLEENRRTGAPNFAQRQDSKMADLHDGEGRGEEDATAVEKDARISDVNVGGEGKRVGLIIEDLQKSESDREDKAFVEYVSLLEHNPDLMKFYEADVNCGSFECLVCTGVGAKKNKRFSDVPSLVRHAQKVLRTKKLPEHRGFARAVCKILGWEVVPGPSVILPRGRNPSQEFESNTLTSVTSSDKQDGHRVGIPGTDWEWAAARKLFEEQEARLNGAKRLSSELPEIENYASQGQSVLY